MEEAPAILIQDLYFRYDRQDVLADVNVAIQSGEFTSIIGPNGGGKTTLLKLILGLLQPSRGTIQILGLPPQRARHRIGYMPQTLRLDDLFPVTVMDIALMGRLGRGRSFGPYSSEDREIALTALEDTGLLDIRDRPFSSLSGGQRQRTLIARALACRPGILLLDEPTTNMDPAVLKHFYELLRDLSGKLTVIMVSHDLSFVSEHVRKVVCVNRNAKIHPSSMIKDDHVGTLYGDIGLQVVHHDLDHSQGEEKP